MNTNERAFQRVAKISKEKVHKQELSAEKVELSLVQDMLSTAQDIESKWKEARQVISIEGKKMIDKAMSASKELTQVVQKLKGERQDFVSKAEAIGLDKSSIDRELSKIDQELKKAQVRQDDIAQIIGEINRVI